MASVLIYQRREAVVTLDGSPSPALARAPVWGDWEGAAGKWLRLYEHNVAGGWDSACYGILKLNVDISGQRSVVGFTLNLPFAGWGTARYRAYLYTSEPTPETSGTSQFYAPSGYIKSLDFVNTNPGSAARNVAFTFTGLNITQSALYLWFEIYHSVTASGEPYWPYTYTFNYSGSSSDVLYANLNDATIAVSYKGIPTSYSVSPSTVSTGGAVNVNISNAWPTETVQFYYGNALLGSATISNGAGSVSIPKSWFATAGVTASKTMTVQARLVGTSYTQNFTVQAGDDMKPVVGAPAVSLVQDPAASDFPNTYIANISKAKVQATVSAGSNAGISSVTLTWPGGSAAMSLNSGAYEATVGPIAGDTVFTVTAIDARGMTQQASYSLTGVVPYAPPVITILSAGTYRCDSSGTEEDGGEYVRARAAAQITTSGLPGNAVQGFRFYIQEEPGKGDDLSYNQQAEYWECGATAGRTSDYYETLVFELEDKIQTVTRSVRLPPATRNFTMKRSQDGTYIGIGVLPQHTSGESTVDIEEGGGYYEGGYLWGSITRLNSTATDGSQFSKNFKNVDTNLLHAPQNAEAFFLKDSDSGWSNSPVSGSFGGLRKVIWLDSTHYFVIILETAPTAGRIWISYNGGTWKSMTPA